MAKRVVSLFICVLIILIWSIEVMAATIYIQDSFTDLTKINSSKTSAQMDTVNGWVTLAKKNLTNSMILYPDSYDITIVNNDAVETYQFNGTNMVLNPGLSINGGLTEPVSIAGREGEYALLDRGTKTVSWYHYDGTGMVPNGVLSIGPLIDPRAIDVAPGTYDLAVLDQANLKWFSYDGTGLAPNSYLSFNTGASSNPNSLSLENDNFASVVLDKAAKEIRHNYFNGSSMVLDASKSIRVPGELTNPKSLSVSKDGGLYLIVDDTTVKAYNYDGTEMLYNNNLSMSGFTNPLAVTIKPDSFDYAVLDDNNGSPRLLYYAFNGTAVEEVAVMRITGLDAIGYGNDQLLMGKAVTTAGNVSGLKLLATMELPVGTSITWEVTVDGVIWKPITPGGATVRFATPGIHPNYRAVLHTEDPTITPKILDVQLLDASLSVVGRSDKATYKAGEAMILYADTDGAVNQVEAIMWWVGGNGFTADTNTDLVPNLPVTNDLNTWFTPHDYPSNYDRVVIIPQNMPDGNYTIVIKASNASNEAEDTIPIQVTGSQFNRIMSEIGDQRYMPND